MPKIDMNLLNEEVPTTRKSTIVNETNETKSSLFNKKGSKKKCLI